MNTYESLRKEPYFGLSPIIEAVKLHINVAAAAPCAVLLCGETGTGKGVIAHWIHDHSSRKDRAFMDINCSGLKGELLKSELFGHIRGSFTGAVDNRPGLIEEADGGTLFLDEIGDMDIDVQCLLLKAIEEKTYRRVGENKLRSSDFRLICATNRDLREAMKNGAFRPDLYYRINTITVSLPPLKERGEDIAGLLRYTLAKMDYRLPLPEDVVSALTRYPWPGNIRELRNAVERALVFAQGKPLIMEHFSGFENTPGNPPPEEPVWNLEAIEKAHIMRALKHFHGNKQKACAALGISPTSMYRKLEKIWNESGGNDLIAEK